MFVSLPPPEYARLKVGGGCYRLSNSGSRRRRGTPVRGSAPVRHRGSAVYVLSERISRSGLKCSSHRSRWQTRLSSQKLMGLHGRLPNRPPNNNLRLAQDSIPARLSGFPETVSFDGYTPVRRALVCEQASSSRSRTRESLRHFLVISRFSERTLLAQVHRMTVVKGKTV